MEGSGPIFVDVFANLKNAVQAIFPPGILPVTNNVNAINAKNARNDQNVENAENAKNTCHARTATNAKIPGFNNERLFYHNGQGTKWGGGGAPPRGVSIAKSRHVEDGEKFLDVFRPRRAFEKHPRIQKNVRNRLKI